MAQPLRCVARQLGRLLAACCLLGFFVRPSALAGPPMEPGAPALGRSPARGPAAPAELFPLLPRAATPAAAPAPAAYARGYVAPPFDTSILDRYPQPASGAALPARWDWRPQGAVTRVQHQGLCGACYAFATLATLESQSLIRDGILYDFSENNLAECNYEETGCLGGNMWVTANRLSAYGAVTEACDPYDPADQPCKTSCPAVVAAQGVWVLGGKALPPTDALKGWLQAYGPLFVTMDAGTPDSAWGQEFERYNGSYTLYAPMTSPVLNHAVTLVGWDDNLAHAGGSGAWIVKNSWGAGWGGACGYGAEKGYFTMAYGSAGLGSNPALVRDWRPVAANAELLYHDEAGLQGGATGPYGLARLTPTRNGRATQVEFWTFGPSTVDVALYDTFNGQSLSGLLWQKEGVSVPYAGYHSVAIDASVPLRAGDDVNVRVKFSTTGSSYPVPIDDMGPASANHSFISRTGASGSWTDTGALSEPYDMGIRLRVAGPDAPPTATATLTPAPPTATPTFTPAPPTKTPTWGPSPTRSRVWLPLMLRQWSPAPRPTATPPPTAAPGGARLLPNHLGYVDFDGALHVLGEVQNDTESILSGVLVTVNIYDQGGAWLAQESDFALLDNLMPGDKTCFHVWLDPVAGAANYGIEAPDYWTDGQAPPDLVITDGSGAYDPDSGWYLLTGEVRNQEDQPVAWVKVVGALYRGDEKVQGCDYVYVNKVDLAAGESSAFELVYGDVDYVNVESYRLQAEADWP